MKTPSLISLLLFFFCQANAQDWKVIGEFNSGVDCLYADEKSDLLYVGGAFDSINHIVSARGVATWNGNNWATLDLGVDFDTVPFPKQGGVLGINSAQNGLIISGIFNNVGYYQKSKNAALWNTDSLKWEPLNWNSDGAIDFVLEQNDTLFVLGTYDSIGGGAGKGVNYLYQNQWTNMSPPDGAEIPEVLVPYLGSYYLGGNMNGSIPGANDIARWDGVKFHPVGTGVSGGFGWVNDMIVYQNELYIGGSFTIASGHTGDYIMKWDGQQYHNVGNANRSVFDLEIHNGILYVAGIFTSIDGIQCNGLAWYDGTNWNEIEYNTGDFITDISFFRDTLYGHRNNNGIQEILKYQKGIPNSIEQETTETPHTISPNPSSNFLRINGFSSFDNYIITNLQGKETLTGNSRQINISHLNPGVYFIRIFSQHHSQTLKFIKL